MFSIAIGNYGLLCSPDTLPDIYSHYRQHAALADEIDLNSAEGAFCFIAVQHGTDWPFLVVAQRYNPAGNGFNPGIALVPETGIIFIGAGTRLLAYKLEGPQKLWEDTADFGFWGWRRHTDYIIMSAELELAAWTIHGQKLWSTFVEPPWDYSISKGEVLLDVMGKKSSFSLERGPS